MNLRRMALGWTLVLIAPATALGEIDVSKPMLCAITEAIDCGYEKPCSYGPVEDVNIPPFIVVDSRSMVLREHNGTRTSVLQTVAEKDGQVVMRGHEQRPFTISISKRTGRLSASAIGPDAGFVFFGICTNQ